MRVVRYPHPTLLQTARELDLTQPGVLDDVRQRVEEMFPLMDAERGVGLAAPQVDWPVRLFVMSPSGEPEDRLVFINPKIIARKGRVTGEEGCLSLPGIYIEVRRARIIEVTWFGLDGKDRRDRFEGFPGRVIQHEFDHLEGITLVDRMSATDRARYQEAIEGLEQSPA